MTQEELGDLPVGAQVEFDGISRYTKTAPGVWEFRYPEGTVIKMMDHDLCGAQTKLVDPLVLLAETQD